jgi:methionine aminopeptidase
MKNKKSFFLYVCLKKIKNLISKYIMNTSSISEIGLYKQASGICKKVYEHLKNHILNNKERNIKKLVIIGNNLINEELIKLEQIPSADYQIAYPVTISLNNCIGQGSDETITDTDLVKIELGVSVAGFISILADSFVVKKSDNNRDVQKMIKLLNKLQDEIVGMMKAGETNDEIRILIESKCAEKNVFPIQNCVSNEQFQGQLHTKMSKYIILNYKPLWDTDDYLTNEENLCFEFEDGDIYTINLSITPETEEPIVYKTSTSNLCRFNEFNYNLKLQSSRQFYNQTKSKFKQYAFDLSEYQKDAKNRVGIKECTENGILEHYNVSYAFSKNIPVPVVTKKFTVMIRGNKCILL